MSQRENLTSKQGRDDSLPAVLRRRYKALREDGYNHEFCNVFKRAADALERAADEPKGAHEIQLLLEDRERKHDAFRLAEQKGNHETEWCAFEDAVGKVVDWVTDHPDELLQLLRRPQPPNAALVDAFRAGAHYGDTDDYDPLDTAEEARAYAMSVETKPAREVPLKFDAYEGGFVVAEPPSVSQLQERIAVLEREADDRSQYVSHLELRLAQPPADAYGRRQSPDGYAYRYHEVGGDVLRFNGGQSANGSKPFECVPYWIGDPLTKPAAPYVMKPSEEAAMFKAVTKRPVETSACEHLRRVGELTPEGKVINVQCEACGAALSEGASNE